MNGPVSLQLSYAFPIYAVADGLVRRFHRVGNSSAHFEIRRRRRSPRVPRDTRALYHVTMLLLTIPSSVGLLLLGESMIGIV